MFVMQGEVIARYKSKKGNQIYQIMVQQSNGNKRVINLISNKKYNVGERIEVVVTVPNINFVFEVV